MVLQQGDRYCSVLLQKKKKKDKPFDDNNECRSTGFFFFGCERKLSFFFYVIIYITWKTYALWSFVVYPRNDKPLLICLLKSELIEEEKKKESISKKRILFLNALY